MRQQRSANEQRSVHEQRAMHEQRQRVARCHPSTKPSGRERLGVLVVALAAALSSGCANLEAIELGECGNGVVEASAGEECDTFPEGNCGAPDTGAACRFVCTPPGSDDAPMACPAAFGCGDDGVCRRSSGEYTPGAILRQGYTLRVQDGDFDGDGYSEVVSITPLGLGVHYLDEAGNQQDQFDINGSAIVPAIGDLTDDTLSDLVILRPEFGGGLNVLRGRPDGVLQPTAYSPFEVGDGDGEVVILDAMETISPLDLFKITGDEILLLTDAGIFSAGQDGRYLTKLPDQVGRLAGRPQVAQLDESTIRSPCQELVLAYQGASSVWVYTPCYRDGAKLGWNHHRDKNDEASPPLRQLPPVTLPSGRRISEGVRLADFNADGHVDMMIGVAQDAGAPLNCPGSSELFITFGVGDGTFHSDIGNLPFADGDGRAVSVESSELCSLPLALADLNGDGAVDLVVGQTIMMSDSTPVTGPLGAANYSIAAANFDNYWTSAVIADFNANGFPDVITTSEGSTTIELYNSVGDGRLNRFELQARGQPSELVVGDFDGDLVNDLAFKEQGPHGKVSAGVETGDSLSIAFGNGFGGLSAPISMGRLARIERLAAGNIADVFADGISDLLALSSAETSSSRSIALLSGRSDRQLVSPFIFDADGSTAPTRAIVGEFTGDDHADIAVIGSTRLAEFGDGPVGNRLWIVPTTGEAAIDHSSLIQSAEFNALASGGNALLASLDLDGDGVDELIGFGSNGSEGVVVVVQVAGDQLKLSQTESTSELYYFDPAGNAGGVPPPAPTGVDEPGDPGGYVLYNGQIMTRDIDGDGLQDLLVLGLTLSELDAEPRLVFYRNQGDGTLDVAGRVTLGNPEGHTPSAFTLTQADADPELEVVLIDARGGMIADLDLPGRKLVPRGPIAGVRGGASVVSSDYNGDGVLDLAIAGEGGAQLFLGEAVIK